MFAPPPPSLSLLPPLPALQASQAIDGHVGAFVNFRIQGNPTDSGLLCLASRTAAGGKLHILEVGGTPSGNQAFEKKAKEIEFAPDAAADFPVAIQVCTFFCGKSSERSCVCECVSEFECVSVSVCVRVSESVWDSVLF